ncbi:MAG: ABC transporter ATP-binding protein [Candidatus Methanomethylophilaceae archaeon]|nr:ABC transporter ATP-binding protein [Candidatus Methanomethylophilaceae archaeon]
MDEGNAIEVKNVYKYFVSRGSSQSFKDLIVYRDKKKEKHEVLRDISFNVRKGEVVGIIGRNGSGKSTMLKLLTKILRPNSGTIETKGTMSCLIELGAGFHPDMTGRENVYINASIFGLTYKEINERFDKILEFSEIGEHIDERVRNYSSGMYLRLAFAIAINVDAEILIVDEILAVGDIAFQKKCLDKIDELRRNGVSIVIVTHSVEQVISLCDKAIWIDNGDMRAIGDVKEVCDQYVEAMVGKQE